MLQTLQLMAMNTMAGAVLGPFQNMHTAVEQITQGLKYIFPGIAIVFVIVSAVLITTGRRGSEIGKSWLVKVCEAVAIFAIAATLVTWLISIFGGSGSTM